LRASIILLADEGQNHREIAGALNISRDGKTMAKSMVRVARKTFPWGAIADAERPGGPMRFSLEQILQLFAIACEPTDDPSAIGHLENLLRRWSNRGLSARFRLGMWGAYWQKQISNRTSPSTG